MDQALDTPDIATARARRDLDFRKDINGLRALAVLGVVAFHADRSFFPGGFAGVDVFFVISGFLISRIILSECAAGDFRLTMFYAKRAKRILPALLIVVACIWTVGWFRLAPDQFHDIGGGMLANSYFTVNFWYMRLAGETGYFGADSTMRPLLHLWSLSIEEQFYLVWSVLLLVLFRVRRTLLLPAIGAIFLASLAACLALTPMDPVAAFYLPWTRGWELALGALLAYREVFLIGAWPYPGRKQAEAGAVVGVALILGAFFLLSGAEPFPGWRAVIPTAGCALVIASPRSRFADLALGNPVSSFFGVVSYPLYLWHWPLFSFAHMWPGVIPTPGVMLALAVVAIALAALTYRVIEAKAAALFRRRPAATALALLGLLAASGIVGRVTYEAKGFPGRFPPLVTRILDYRANGADGTRLMRCFYPRDERRYSLEDERARAAGFFDSHRCGAVDDPGKPTILVVGDSHAAHLFAGLAEVFGGKANILALASVFCAPLIEHPDMDAGIAGTPRCRAINEAVFERIRAIRPDVLLVSGYFSSYDHEPTWRYPDYLDALVANARRLHDEGVRSIVIAGEVPTWAPVLPILVAQDVLERGEAAAFSSVGVRSDSLETDKRLAGKNWGEGVRYVSQAQRLCGPDGCRRLVGPNLPEDMIAVDYGHYSVNGSIFAVRTILAPVIEAELAKNRR